MQYLDELLALYPDANRSNKKFILASLLDATPDRCGDESARLLWEAMAEQDPVVRRQARYVLGRLLPRHTAQNYGLQDTADRASQLAKTRVEANDNALEAEQRELVQVAGYLLRKVLRETYELARSGTPMLRDAACLLLGRLWTHRTVKALAERTLKDGRVSFGPAFALVEAGHKHAREALYGAAWSAGPADPDIYMLLGSLPTKPSLTILEKHEEKASTYARTNIAHALSSFPPAMARPLVERIVSRNEDWPTAFVLDSIAAWGDATFFDLARTIYDRESSRFLRAQAARAIGSFRAEEAVAFCRARLKDPDPVVQSAALDGLIRNARDLSALREEIVPLARSPSARLRVRTMLLLAQSDPALLQDMLADMVSSSSMKERRAAVYVLGFLGGQGVEDLLASMALDDPAPGVRCQAIRSLGGLDTPAAVELLVVLASQTCDMNDLKEAVRALAAVRTTLVGGALEGLLALESMASGSAGRAQILRGIGVLAALAWRSPPDALLASLSDSEPAVVAGALEGLRRLGRGVPLDDVRKLEHHPDAKVRTRAAGALLASGDFSVSKLFVEMLTSGQEAVQMSALNILLDVACLIPLAVASDRFEGLSSSLRRQKKSPEFTTYQEGALVGTQSQVDLRLVAKPAQIEVLVEHSIRKHHTAAHLIPDVKTLRVVYRKAVRARPGATTGAGSWKAALRAAFRWPQVLIFVPFLVLAFFAARAVEAPAPGEVGVILGPSGLARGVFGTVELTGVCTGVGPGGKPRILRDASVFSAGDQLETDGRAGATLADSLGNSIKLGPSSRLSFAAAEAMVWSPVEVRYSFDEIAGSVMLDFRKVSETKVRLGSSMFTLGRGSARIEDDPPGKRITQLMGEGTLIEGNGQLVRLAPGKSALVLVETSRP